MKNGAFFVFYSMFSIVIVFEIISYEVGDVYYNENMYP